MSEEKSVLDALEKTGDLYRDKLAVRDPGKALSWGQLIEKSKMAGQCIASIVQGQVGFPAVILSDKNVELLTAMTGVIYAGGFYLVLNPEQPAQRMEKILEVSCPKLVICQAKYRDKLLEAGWTGTIYDLDYLTEEIEPFSRESMAAVREQIHRDSPLYGIFTSGSTGCPKCVLVSHGAVMDFIGHFAKIFDFSSDDVIASQAPFDFDVSIKDIFTAFFTGASLLLIPREYFSTPKTLMDYLCDNHVTNLTWAVSALCIISGLNCFSYRRPTDLKRVMFSGEVMPIKQLNIWMDAIPNARFVNLYGPSEITCNCTYYEIQRRFEKDEKLPLGKAFPGREVLLLDSEGQVVKKANCQGEICVMGESLAIGYYHNPEETDKHFVKYGPDHRKMYQTGDLAYYGDDGEMYFAGRKDFQIKHMGHRIELEEIERNIDAVEGVDRCICSFDDKKNRIYLYYKGRIDKKTLHRQIKDSLPLYMVPNKFFHVRDFVLNKNGKADRKALSGLEMIEDQSSSTSEVTA